MEFASKIVFFNIHRQTFTPIVLTLLFILGTVFTFNPVIDGEVQHNRSSKWLPFIVIIGNEACNSTDSHEVGTCFTEAQCSRAGGSPKGFCASGFGVCCVIVSTCYDTISKNNTYFRSMGFPDHFKPNGHKVCGTRILKPVGKDVCQVKLIFHDMELVEADGEHGHCLIDNINLLGMANANLPHLCGPLSKQHLYLEFGIKSYFKLSISMDGFQDQSGRKWNVQVIFIGCKDLNRAPSGCLQYYTGSAGTVKILGYPTSPHLAGLAYTICVRKELAAKSIFWFPCRDVPFEKSFHLQGPDFLTTSFFLFWISCFGDFIMIMSDDATSTALPNYPKDRYCGNRLTNLPPFYVNSKVAPFVIFVRTDFIEDPSEVGNVGFCLEWYEAIWTPNPNSTAEMPIIGPPEGP